MVQTGGVGKPSCTPGCRDGVCAGGTGVPEPSPGRAGRCQRCLVAAARSASQRLLHTHSCWTTSSSPKHTVLPVPCPQPPSQRCQPSCGDTGGRARGTRPGWEQRDPPCVCCSLLKACALLPPVALHSCFCLSGLKAWKRLRVARRCQEQRAQGVPSSAGGTWQRGMRKGHGPPCTGDLGCRGGPTWGAAPGLAMNQPHMNMQTPNPSQAGRNPEITHTRPQPRFLTTARRSPAKGLHPLPVPGPRSQAHGQPGETRGPVPADAMCDVVFSHSTGAGPSGSEILGGFVSHTGCHQEMQIHVLLLVFLSACKTILGHNGPTQRWPRRAWELLRESPGGAGGSSSNGIGAGQGRGSTRRPGEQERLLAAVSPSFLCSPSQNNLQKILLQGGSS